MLGYNVAATSNSYVDLGTVSAGRVYLTNDTLPNPWDTLPSYFEPLLGYLR